jgi:hypothetical protein
MRTLLVAGVFALLAMVFVPNSDGYYRLIFDTSEGTSIALVQLLVNVGFAALAGAIVANLSKHALYVIGPCIVLVAVGLGVFVAVFALKQARKALPVEHGPWEEYQQSRAVPVSPTPTEKTTPEPLPPVEAADLRKIILFDVTYDKIEDDNIRSDPFEDPFFTNPFKALGARIMRIDD